MDTSRRLCQRVGTPLLFCVLWGFWAMSDALGGRQTRRALGEELLSLAQRLDDPALL
jgi:hypothetical protein